MEKGEYITWLQDLQTAHLPAMTNTDHSLFLPSLALSFNIHMYN